MISQEHDSTNKPEDQKVMYMYNWNNGRWPEPVLKFISSVENTYTYFLVEWLLIELLEFSSDIQHVNLSTADHYSGQSDLICSSSLQVHK